MSDLPGAMTKQILDAGHLLNIEVLDHIIIGRAAYASMKDRGLGFPKKPVLSGVEGPVLSGVEGPVLSGVEGQP